MHEKSYEDKVLVHIPQSIKAMTFEIQHISDRGKLLSSIGYYLQKFHHIKILNS